MEQKKIQEQKEETAESVEEVKEQKQGSSTQDVIAEKDKQIKELTDAVNELQTRLNSISKYGVEGTDLITVNGNQISRRTRTLVQQEAKRLKLSEPRSKSEILQMEIASLVLSFEKLNLLIQQGEEAKITAADVSRVIAKKRKDLAGLTKDMESTKTVNAGLMIQQGKVGGNSTKFFDKAGKMGKTSSYLRQGRSHNSRKVC
eukprot:TRINITY_DN4811_c0_g1_i1.p1 TRINITY_DN4811_c0_g1~~TRINITY_DN4811_c0_g1_i1.p1  ORF type:complete len:202 (+),score=54.43 TRINITY_DN4811_c0_g1_i1:184-789(+)